jgi:hypothetical protein
MGGAGERVSDADEVCGVMTKRPMDPLIEQQLNRALAEGRLALGWLGKVCLGTLISVIAFVVCWFAYRASDVGLALAWREVIG